MRPATCDVRPATLPLIALVATTVLCVLAAPDADAQVAAPASPGRLAYLGLQPPGDVPVLFAPGDVSSDAREINAVFSRDGRELYFTRVVDGRASLFVRRLGQDAWTPPERLTLIAGQPDMDIADPALSPDGQRLYFVSGARNDLFPPGNGNIWVSRREGDRWGDAVILPAPVNSSSAEYYPSVVADGSLYFSSNRDGGTGDLDLYRAQYGNGAFKEVTNLGAPINTPQTEVDAYVAPDERMLIVSARRDGNRGALDLYVSFRQRDGAWGTLTHLGDAINTELTDYCPMVTPDGRFFFFSRRTAQGGDVYWMQARALDQFRPGRTTTPTGLTYTVVEQGAGPAARPGQHVLIHETTTFADGRVHFTTEGGKPLRFLLGGNQVIAGVDEGVTGMRVGERRRLVVPPALSRRSAYPEGLSPEAILYYDITLVAIEPPDGPR